jgi:peroxiredoxin
VLVEGKGYAARVTFFIDPDGVLRHVDRTVKPEAHGRDVVETLRRLRG